jgi:hypothetical protein
MVHDAKPPPGTATVPKHTYMTAIENDDHCKRTGAPGFRSDGLLLGDYRFCFKTCGQAVGWSRLRARSESPLRWFEEVSD